MNLYFEIRIMKDDKNKEFKYYRIYKYNDNNIWIGNEDGEGMKIDENALYECIDKFFKDNF